MSSYDLIVGHKQQISQLETARRSGRVAHAYLFFGPDGVGKEKVALAFAQALNCQREEAAPCGICDSCQRILKGIHADVRLVASEETLVERGLLQAEKGKTPSTQIRNVQLDELASLFRHRPYMGKKKVVVVVDAENMNVNSQNRFLKTLEEPTADTVIVLLSSHPEALLATVRSRCQSLGFGPIDKAQIHTFLMEHYRLEPDRAAALAAMSQGSLGNAVKLAEGKILETRDQVTGALAQIRKGNLAGILSSVDELASSREPADETLNLLELWCRDLLVAVLKLPQQYLANQDCREQIVGDAVGVDPRRLLRWMERIRWTRGVLKNNANPRMAMESLFLHMRMH